MSEANPTAAQLAELLKAMGSPVPAGAGWGAAPTAAAPLGVLVPIELDTPAGKVTVQLQYGPEFADPGALMGLLQSLAGQGYPIKAYQPKDSGGWGNRGGGGGGWNGGNRGGWGGNGNGNGGGWRR